MKAWFRLLSETYGWTPEQIGRLTLPQARMYLGNGGKGAGGGKGRPLTRQEFLALVGRGNA